MSSLVYYLFGWDTEEEVKDAIKDKQKHQKYLSCKAIEKGVKLKKTSLLTNLLKQKKQDSERKIYAKTYADVLFHSNEYLLKNEADVLFQDPKKTKREVEKTWGRPNSQKVILGSNFTPDSIL